MISDYAPTILDEDEGYVLFALKTFKCPSCGKRMMTKARMPYYFQPEYNVFPLYAFMDQDTQMQRARIVYIGAGKINDKPICVECCAAGKARFICVVCQQERTSDQFCEDASHSYTDPRCTICYNSVSAAEWKKIDERLDDDHRYD